jgi:hypothetical protein
MLTYQTHPTSPYLCVEGAVGTPEYFEIMEDHAVFRPFGQVSQQQAVQLVTSAIAFAREHHVLKLLVVMSGLTGFERPSIIARYFYAKKWAEASRGAVRVALVDRPEMIDPPKFAVMAASNSGLLGDVFTSEDDALAWLE